MADEINTRRTDASGPLLMEGIPPSILERFPSEEVREGLKHLVGQIADLVKSVARTEGWPLKRIEVNLYQDPEVTVWEYLVVLLVFDASFALADKYLHHLYLHLARFSQGLPQDERVMFRRLIFFDIDVTQSTSGYQSSLLS